MNESMTLFNRTHFVEKLLEWWKENKREFPWRKTKDPYQILVAEVLLHRTKADQVLPIYSKFIEKFPTVKELAHATLEDVKKVLHPLGLHWRTRELHQMAIVIMQKYNGKIPHEREKLESLPGVSRYIASAVRCFAFNYPEIMLDTNIVRILGRIFEVKVTDSSRRSKHFIELYKSVANNNNTRELNLALIDLGALICKPKNPMCKICPIMQICAYGHLNKSDIL